MIHLLSITYIGLVVLQPAEWIRIFEGIPIVELNLLVILGFILLLKSEKFAEVLRSYPSRFFGGFIIVSILSVLAAGDDFSYAFGVIGYKYFKIYLAYLVLIVANDDPSKIRKTFFWTIVFGCVVSYLCINLMLTGVGVGAGIGLETQTLNWRGSVQWIGTFGGGNTTGLLLLFILAMSIGCLYKESSRIKQLFYLSTTAWIGTAFIMTNSRGGTLGLLAVLVYFFYIKTKIRLKVFLPMALVLVVLILVLKPQEEGRGISESSTPERVELYHQGLQMFKSNPFFGVGSSRFPNHNYVRKTAHNIYLNTLAETGFFGFFLFMTMLYAPIKKIRDGLPSIDDEDLINRNIKTSFLISIGVGVSLFFLSADHELPYIVLALLVASANQINNTYNISSKEYRTIFKLIVLLIIAVYIAIQLFFTLYR